MTDAMKAVADVIPLNHVTGGLRREWLGSTDGNVDAWWPLVLAVAAIGAAVWLTRRRAD
jgi:hypothetical protein